MTPASSRSRRRDASSEREIPGSPRSISLKRWLPRMSSRTMSGVHRSARISDARATGQYCLYFCMPHPGTPDSPVPVQKLNRFSPLVALPRGLLHPRTFTLSKLDGGDYETRIWKACGRVGGRARRRCEHSTRRHPPRARLSPPHVACWIRAELRTPKRPVRDALLQTGA